MHVCSQLNGLCDVRDFTHTLVFRQWSFFPSPLRAAPWTFGQNTGTHNNNLMFNQSPCQWPSVSLLWTAVMLSWGDNVTCLGWQHVVTWSDLMWHILHNSNTYSLVNNTNVKHFYYVCFSVTADILLHNWETRLPKFSENWTKFQPYTFFYIILLWAKYFDLLSSQNDISYAIKLHYYAGRWLGIQLWSEVTWTFFSVLLL